MKSARTLITICLLLTTAALFAQLTPSERLMKVNVPFAFGVEDRSVPSSEYTVFTITPERSIRLVSGDGKHSAVINTYPTMPTSLRPTVAWCSISTEASTSWLRSGRPARM
jgi:hypothetical protein